MVKIAQSLIHLVTSRLRVSISREDRIRAIAEKIYVNREAVDTNEDAETDWTKAERIEKVPVYRLLFWMNQPLVTIERHAVEPIARWIDKADLFRIIERISPALEALGVIAIPFVLFFAGQQYQNKLQEQENERLQQQAVKDYLSQLSTILLEKENELRDPDNDRLRVLMTATTLTLLREPNLNGERKGQVIKFLAEMDLVHRPPVYGPFKPDDEGKVPTLSLNGANLELANLSFSQLSNADLRVANLYGATLIGAHLEEANMLGAYLVVANLEGAHLNNSILAGAKLSGADLSSADMTHANLASSDLSATNLSGADLKFAELIDADLIAANLSVASLDFANLKRANLVGADLTAASLKNTNLSGANLITTQVSKEILDEALLCQTLIPREIDIDPNRDCETQ